MNNIVIQLLSLQNHLQVYHWSTSSFARHEASGKLYTFLVIKIDQFLETYQGSYNKKLKINKAQALPSIKTHSDASMGKYLRDCVSWLNHLALKKDASLINIRDEMVAEIHKTLYLFTFE
jgi:hypothetical protein